MCMCHQVMIYCFVLFFFNDPATTEIYTLSLHDALPICAKNGYKVVAVVVDLDGVRQAVLRGDGAPIHSMDNADRKSTRLNSSHMSISYAVFCLKKKKT